MSHNNTSTSQSSASLLIVDDEEPIRHILACILERDGYDCVLAADVAEARDRLSEHHFDVVLTDMEMPGESGAELVRHVRNRNDNTATIVITGNGDANVGKSMIELGATAYLEKPCSGDALLATVLAASRRHTDADRVDREQQVLRKMVETRQSELWEYALELEKAAAELTTSQLETIQRLVRAAESRDDETGEHVQRVSRYARLLAELTGIGKDRSDRIGTASVLHDIGKIAVPDAILRKCGTLTHDERALMQEHCRAGHDILKGSDCELLQVAATIALSHHERWDGTGYPRGLSGEAIPVEARIVAVADVFDALTTKRVYRGGPIPLVEALDIMRQGRATQFDPMLLDIFFSSLDLVLRIANPDSE